MIDLHCHVLPGIDDGPGTDEQALALARFAVALGTQRHRGDPAPQPALAHRARSGDRGRGAAGRAAGGGRDRARAPDRRRDRARGGGPPRRPDALGAGASGPATICCSRARTSRRASGSSARSATCSPAGSGSSSPIRSAPRSSRTGPGRLRKLVAAGALCSVTAGALEGHFGPAAQWFALELLRDGLVHSVASDAHAAVGRPPGLQAGLDAAARHLPEHRRAGALADARRSRRDPRGRAAAGSADLARGPRSCGRPRG